MKTTAPKAPHGRPHAMVDEADSLLDRLGHSALGEEAQALMAKLREAVEVLRTTAEDAQAKVKSGLMATEHAVKRHPLRSVGIAVGAGFALGYIIHWLGRKTA